MKEKASKFLENFPIARGVAKWGEEVLLFLSEAKIGSESSGGILRSKDGEHFHPFSEGISSGFSFRRFLGNFRSSIISEEGFHASFLEEKISLVFVRRLPMGLTRISRANSSDGIRWSDISDMEGLHEAGVMVALSSGEYRYALFSGARKIKLALSTDGKIWKSRRVAILHPREGRFDGKSVRIGTAFPLGEGILIFYLAESIDGRRSIGAALFDALDPTKILWRSRTPLWQQDLEWKEKAVRFVGMVPHEEQVLVYWEVDGKILVDKISRFWSVSSQKHPIITIAGDAEFRRYHGNPVLSPQGENVWESEAVFNPAALRLDGKTHLVYRAIGGTGESLFGYASSRDGFFFDKRSSSPICSDRSLRRIGREGCPRSYSPVLYPSGGSWGGYEDPRVVEIDGRIYVTFNLFENWLLRVGYISLSREDFLAGNFDRWDGPHILSHGVRDKNWVLFPEKIGGQFAILHSIIGESDDRVRIEYIDDLKQLRERRFESPDPQKIPDRLFAWHLHVRSAGPPPIKTSRGWLLFYHANDAESHKYKVGAMLLDLDDPTYIIARASSPVLVPDAIYENDGKPGIVYAAGVTIHDGEIHLYYGGADRVTCVATAPTEAFLDALVSSKEPMPMRTISIEEDFIKD